jgi:hypothetical protein
VNVVPMDEDRVMRGQVVIVQGRFITHIASVDDDITLPSDAHVINGHGERYLVPGLTDAHVHLGYDAEALLPLFLANGVTTVFNLEGTPRHLVLRKRIQDGEVAGPTIYTAGPYIDGTGVRSPAEAVQVVMRQKAAGYDFLKVHGDLTKESFRALTITSSQEGIPVVGHAQRDFPISTVLQSSQAAISHAEELIYTAFMGLHRSELSEVANAMADAGTWLTPGLVNFEASASQWGRPDTMHAILASERARYLPANLRRKWASSEYVIRDPGERWEIMRMLEFHEPLILALYRAGVPLLAGTDASMPGVTPGFSLADEITALREVGLSRYEALAAATRNAGRFINDHVDEDATFGIVRAGARADLILLTSDPRESLDALRQPVGVMAQGRYYDESELEQLLNAALRR